MQTDKPQPEKHSYEVRTPYGSFTYETRSGIEGCKQAALTIYPSIKDIDHDVTVHRK